MGRRLIEVMEVLVDQVHKAGYQHRVLEDSIYEEKQKRIAAEKDRDHWKQARQEAHEAGELMRAEIETLRKELADAEHPPAMAQQRDEIAYLRARLDEERSVSAGLRDKLAEAQQPDVGAMRAFVGKVRACVWACYEWPQSWHKIEAALVELDAGTEPTPVAEPLDAEGDTCHGK